MKAYSTFDIARMLQVDPGSVANWIDQGLLIAHRTPGGHRRVMEADLRAFLEAHKMPLPPQLAAASKRVLVVEAEKAVMDSIRAAFRTSHPDYEVLEAQDGFRAGSLLATCRPNVVILDLKMPGMDAFDICRLIKSQPDTKDIHIVATSPRSEHAKHRKEILRCGASACLSRPLDINLLMKEALAS